jgi:hypothetical protein
MWEKRTLWENSAHVPLIIRAPWAEFSHSIGKRTKQVARFCVLCCCRTGILHRCDATCATATDEEMGG